MKPKEALRGVMVEVTETDIFNGKSLICPLEWAIRRYIKPGLQVNVGSRAVLIREPGKNGRQFERFLTRHPRDFVRDYDTDKDVQPLRFVLKAPAWVLKEPGEFKSV